MSAKMVIFVVSKTLQMKETLRFLQDLSLNNNKEWFNANKDRHLAAKASVDALAADPPYKTHLGIYINRAIDFVREEKKEYFSSLVF